MSITEVPAEGDRFDDETGLQIPPTPARSPNTSGPPSKPKSGGPKTRAGKEKSSRNATTLGVFSKSPIVGDERLEDWLACLEGLRDSLGPIGYLEDQLVYDMALTMQHKDRLDRYMNAIVQHQFDDANAFERNRAVVEYMDLPGDGTSAFWHNSGAARPIVEAIIEGDTAARFNRGAAHIFFLALTIGCEIDETTTPGFPAVQFDNWTMREARLAVEVVVKSSGHDIDWVLIRTMLAISKAEMEQQFKESKDARDHQLELAQALLPPQAELDKLMRYGTRLDTHFDKLLRRFELAQRARNGALPPPLRLDIQES